MDIWCLTIKHPWTEEMFANEKKEIEAAEKKKALDGPKKEL